MLTSGTLIYLPNSNGKSPLHMADKKNDRGLVISMLNFHYVDNEIPIVVQAIRARRCRSWWITVQTNNLEYKDGCSLLVETMLGEDQEIVGLLLKHGQLSLKTTSYLDAGRWFGLTPGQALGDYESSQKHLALEMVNFFNSTQACQGCGKFGQQVRKRMHRYWLNEHLAEGIIP